MRHPKEKWGTTDCLLMLLLAVVIAFSLFYFLGFSHKGEREGNVPAVNTVSDILVENMSFLKPYELQSEGYELAAELKVTDEAGEQVYLHNILGGNELH